MSNIVPLPTKCDRCGEKVNELYTDKRVILFDGRRAMRLCESCAIKHAIFCDVHQQAHYCEEGGDGHYRYTCVDCEWTERTLYKHLPPVGFEQMKKFVEHRYLIMSLQGRGYDYCLAEVIAWTASRRNVPITVLMREIINAPAPHLPLMLFSDMPLA